MAAGFLSLLVVSSMPVAELLLVGVAGAFLATARCGNVLTPSARADINRVVYAVFTPALMLASLANTVTLRDVVAWWFMPVNIGIAFLAGGALGWVAVLLLRPPQQLRGLVIASCSAANFGNLLLVVIPAVCEEDGNPFGLAKTICTDHGLSYASFSMALGGLYIWTHTHSIMKRSGEVYRRMRQAASSIAPVTCVVVDPSTESVIRQEENKHSENDGGSGAISPSSQSIVAKGEHQISVPLLSDSSNHHRSAEGKNLWGRLKEGMHEMTQELTSPPTTGAAIGLVIGTVPWFRSVFVGSNAPLRAVQDSLKLLGDGTIPCLMLILGGNLTKGLRKTKVPPAVVVAIICVRYVILPLVGVAVVRAARDMGFLPPDPLYQYTLMMHFAVPPAMSIGTMSQLYDVGQEECSVILLWTYLVAALALTVWSTIFMWILQ